MIMTESAADNQGKVKIKLKNCKSQNVRYTVIEITGLHIHPIRVAVMNMPDNTADNQGKVKVKLN
jgi:hypothetical protein